MLEYERDEGERVASDRGRAGARVTRHDRNDALSVGVLRT